MQQHSTERIEAAGDARRAMLDDLPIAALWVDGDAVRMNVAAEALTGYRWDEIAYGTEWLRAIAEKAASRRGDPPPAPVREVIVRKDGTLRLVECLAGATGGILLLHDVTFRTCSDLSQSPQQAQPDAVPADLLDMVAVVSPDGRFVALKGHPADVLGFGCDDLVGRPFTEFVHPNDLEGALRAFEVLLKEALPTNFSCRFRCSGDGYRWLECKAVPPSAGGLLHLALRDISTQKELEQTLRSREQLFRGLFHNAPVGIYLSDVEGKHFIANQRWYEYAGIFVGDVSPQGLNLIAIERDRERISAMWKKALESGREWSSEYSYRTADGRRVWVHGTALQLLDETGEVLGYLGCNIDITERKLAEEALAESETRFRLAMEATTDGLWDVDLERNRCHFSPGCYRMLGYHPDEGHMTYQEWLELVHPEDARRTLSAYQGCAGNQAASFEVEMRMLCKDGTWKWILNRGKAVDGDAGARRPRLVGTFVDISERKVMEEMLRTEHKLLNLIIETSPVGILFTDAEGRLPFVNPRLEEITGFSKDDFKTGGISLMQGRIFTRDGAALPAADTPSQRAICTGQPQRDVCLSFRRKDGRDVFLSINAAPFFDGDGQVGGVVETIEDVTERKEAEEQISESRWLLQESQRIALLGSFVYVVASDAWYSSAKLDDILGIDDGYDKSLQGYLSIVRPDFAEQFRDGFLASMLSGQRFELEHKIVRVSDGQERWVAGFVEPVGGESGAVQRVVATIQDVTERKAHEEAIRHLNEELDRRVIERTTQLNLAKREMETFSYSVSHDLRAPLRHINSYCTILSEDFADELPEKAHFYLERICAASSRMGKLIDDLLKLSRINRAEMKLTPFKISKVAQEIAAALREEHAERDVRFVIADGLMAKGDRLLVRQVLENLMENAVKYSSKRSQATIEFGKTTMDGRQAFFVRDDGAGFDMAYADKLFQPFQRLHGAEFEGTGIGLATVKRIIERHGGRVWASGNVGEGAAFYFTLSGSGRGNGGAERIEDVAAA